LVGVTDTGALGWCGAQNDADQFTQLQLKELKNGRLAMVAISGQLLQEALTGQSTLQQLASGHINPFGDGQVRS
jgi:hypothetical protein